MKAPSIKLFLGVYCALLLLLVTTVGLSFFRLGFVSIAFALVIALVKAILIALFFMHLRYRSKLTWIFAISGMFWLVILFVLAFSDFLTRGWPE